MHIKLISRWTITSCLISRGKLIDVLEMYFWDKMYDVKSWSKKIEGNCNEEREEKIEEGERCAVHMENTKIDFQKRVIYLYW